MLAVLLGATVIGTLSNNSLNVPLRSITAEFHAQVSSGVLVVGAFVIVLSAAMAVSGWIGDRLGRARTLALALMLMCLAQIGAALAPSLGVLVALRAVQGLACSAIPPCVMGLLSTTYPGAQRAKVMGAWAAANGVGQAVGAPFGGLVSQWWGWRAIFWILVPPTLLVLAGARMLPRRQLSAGRLDWPSAILLTVGTATVLSAFSAVSQRAVPLWLDVVCGLTGGVLLFLFVVVSQRSEKPLIRISLLIEPRFFRSAVAAFSQMFALAVLLIAVPLYLTGTLLTSNGVAGLIVFVLPLTMTVLAPGIGTLCGRASPRSVLRMGVLVLALASLCLGLDVYRRGASLPLLGLCMVAAGVGVAMVQTPAATGATRAQAGASGAALGVFNTLRFAGSATGAAWVAVLYPLDVPLVLYGAAAVLLAVALAASFLGTDPISVEELAAPVPTAAA